MAVKDSPSSLGHRTSTRSKSRTSMLKKAVHSDEDLADDLSSRSKSGRRDANQQTENLTSGEDSGVIVRHPKEADVLLGKGQRYVSWKGNLQLKEFLRNSKEVYISAGNKYAKTLVTREITEEFQLATGGRFLKPRDNHPGWLEVNKQKACGKVSQDMRNLIKGKTDKTTAPDRVVSRQSRPRRKAKKPVVRRVSDVEISNSSVGEQLKSSPEGCRILGAQTHPVDSGSDKVTSSGAGAPRVLRSVSPGMAWSDDDYTQQRQPILQTPASLAEKRQQHVSTTMKNSIRQQQLATTTTAVESPADMGLAAAALASADEADVILAAALTSVDDESEDWELDGICWPC